MSPNSPLVNAGRCGRSRSGRGRRRAARRAAPTRDSAPRRGVAARQARRGSRRTRARDHSVSWNAASALAASTATVSSLPAARGRTRGDSGSEVRRRAYVRPSVERCRHFRARRRSGGGSAPTGCRARRPAQPAQQRHVLQRREWRSVIARPTARARPSVQCCFAGAAGARDETVADSRVSKNSRSPNAIAAGWPTRVRRVAHRSAATARARRARRLRFGRPSAALGRRLRERRRGGEARRGDGDPALRRAAARNALTRTREWRCRACHALHGSRPT